jgi:hypothetical protein
MFRLAWSGHLIFEKPYYFLGTALEPLSMFGDFLLILNIPCLVSHDPNSLSEFIPSLNTNLDLPGAFS